MPYNKRIKWKDHVVERPRTYRETENDDGSKTFTAAPGEIIQQGTPQSATNFNFMEEALQHAIITIDFVSCILQARLREKLTIQNNAGFHNSVFRGKCLGTKVTDAQWEAIRTGTFKGMFIGDYWLISGVKYRIAAFDYWLNCGDTSCTTHHIVIIPDTNMLAADGSTTHWMHSSNTTENGYVGTDFYAGTNGNTGKATILAAIEGAFGSTHILQHREYLTNSCKSGSTNVGYPTAGAWCDSKVEIPNEQMVYGCKVFGSRSAGANIPADYTIDKSQLPLFALAPEFICNRAYWWLRDPASAAAFAHVSSNGYCDYHGASYANFGVRPAFGIKA